MMVAARLLGLALGLAVVTAPSAPRAQPAARTARVGFLGLTAANPNLDGLRQGLRDLGWIEGQNLVILSPSAGGRGEPRPDLVADLIRLNVDVIVASANWVRAAKAATTRLPIVFVIPEDPVATGLVATLARPGGNMTGLSSMNVELDAKRLALLKEVLPRLTQVAVLVNPADVRTAAMLAATEAAARAVGVKLQVIKVRAVPDLQAAVRAATRGKAEALTVLGSPFFFYYSRVPELATRARLPVIAAWRHYPEAGALMSYGADIPEMFRRAAVYVDRILKGARPADLPVEQPTKFELVVNLKTAKALGLTIPQSVLARADTIIR